MINYHYYMVTLYQHYCHYDREISTIYTAAGISLKMKLEPTINRK